MQQLQSRDPQVRAAVARCLQQPGTSSDAADGSIQSGRRLHDRAKTGVTPGAPVSR